MQPSHGTGEPEDDELEDEELEDEELEETPVQQPTYSSSRSLINVPSSPFFRLSDARKFVGPWYV